jgi:pilus assembly protein Flp/PilA
MSFATAISLLAEEVTRMLKCYVKTCEAVNRLRTDKDGAVSLEYVIVAAFIVPVVIGAFPGSLPAALTTGFGAITTAMAGL